MMRGYCFIEGESQTKVEDLAADIRILSNRAIQDKEVPISDLVEQLNPKTFNTRIR